MVDRDEICKYLPLTGLSYAKVCMLLLYSVSVNKLNLQLCRRPGTNACA